MTTANSIAYTKNYTAVLEEVYKRAACSTCLNSTRCMVHAGRNVKEIMVPKIQVSGLRGYTHDVGYKTGSTASSRGVPPEHATQAPCAPEEWTYRCRHARRPRCVGEAFLFSVQHLSTVHHALTGEGTTEFKSF